VTALHKDNYENIYVQVVGEKHFVLLPPVAHACIGEKILNPASYVRKEGEKGELGNLVVVEEEGDAVPFATWDPDSPSERATPYSKLASPLRVTLGPGDMMYLPACWQVLRSLFNV
jgi:jumonji domain-containing protein 7